MTVYFSDSKTSAQYKYVLPGEWTSNVWYIKKKKNYSSKNEWTRAPFISINSCVNIILSKSIVTAYILCFYLYKFPILQG